MSNLEKVQRTLPYPMHVASAPIRPENVESWRNNNIFPLIEYHKNNLAHNTSKYQTSQDVLNRLKNIRPSDVSEAIAIDDIVKIQEKHVDLMKKELHQAIVDQLMLEVIASSETYHVPAIDSMYHVYDYKNKKFISLIGPDEWNNYSEYLGSFINKKTHFEIFYLKNI